MRNYGQLARWQNNVLYRVKSRVLILVITGGDVIYVHTSPSGSILLLFSHSLFPWLLWYMLRFDLLLAGFYLGVCCSFLMIAATNDLYQLFFQFPFDYIYSFFI
ncbi:unnamed protein product [Trifolium pratense]|uniref:Uncharacterized protein n=1 Tax=Trifolium pratense TaxID=57577 RepID=A0ACB0K641_TRIPR|nr:unnamed protein product [Trifolium pratense]